MSLERLGVWLEAPRRRPALMKHFCSVVRGATGDEEEQRFTEGVLNETIFDMIGKWIIEGQIVVDITAMDRIHDNLGWHSETDWQRCHC